ncbi:MAG: PQQ-binding-like beta-propeller repeat protein [Candidatus Hydrogenedentes bacterium]|nr:PQQ-binding-like beta-propeller repeat protein [Candidatus Hydrogenedentota bacterium]
MRRLVGFGAVILVLAAASAWCDDWPTYLHDSARSGVTTEQLPAGLHLVWVYETAFRPAPAWPAPAKQDFWHEIRELRPIVTYDRAFHAVVSGDSLLFGSSSDDRAYCLDAATGAVRWTFSCEGPVRLAPTVSSGKAYFGSDDGCVYCVRVSDGALVWKYRPADQDRRLPGNGRVISLAPVRTGITVDGGAAYFCAGLFPPDDVYRCALDAETGAVLWQMQDPQASPQGYMLASPTRLFVPTGRTSPFMYDRATGNLLGEMDGPGGAYALLVDDTVVSGPGRRGGLEMGIAAEPGKEGVASFPCVRMVVSGDVAYLQGKDSLRALNRHEYVRLAVEQRGVQKRLEETVKARDQALGRKDSAAMKQLAEEAKGLEQQISALGQQMESCFTWTLEDAEPYALILAGDTLYSGGGGKVTAVRASDGQQTWSAEVEGNIYGLSVANGRLYASSDTGAIYCFGVDTPVARAEKPAQTPLSPGGFAETARQIVALGGFSKGYCLLLGYDDTKLALDIAQASDLSVLMAIPDETRARALRDELLDAGVAPSRVAAQFVPGPALPYTTYMADVVVLPEPGAFQAAEVYRVLRPYGGTALVGGDRAEANRWLKACRLPAERHEGDWTQVRRGPVDGAGEWTQLYANPGHTACSGETLEGPLGIQWFGEPGPRDIVDRHHRPMSSLFKDGRLFVMGNERIFSVDPYNGTQMWTLDVPDSRRVGALKNSGQAVLTEDCLYVAAKGECWVVDVKDGKRIATFTTPGAGKEQADWGDLNCVGDRLFGTGQKSGASFDVLSRATIDMLEGDFRPVVTSNYAFCLDRHTGKPKWTYRNGAIMNNAITIAGDRLVLVENRTDDMVKREDGRVRVDIFCRDARLVALNVKNGKKVWERPVKFPFQHIMYLSASGDTVLATGSYNEGGRVYYGLFAYDVGSGKPKWATNYLALDNRSNDPAEPGGTHGEQWQHPVIIGDTIYSRPYAFDLNTGEKKDYIARRGGHGCGGLTGSAKYLFGRGSNPRMYPTDVSSTEGIPLTLVSRPGCWLNIIPAGGLVMIPESSSGCTCAYPMQMSVVLAPRGLN